MNQQEKETSIGGEVKSQTTFYEEFFELARTGLVVFDHHAKVIFVDDYLCEITGYDSIDVINKEILSFVDPKEHERLEKHLESLMAGTSDKVFTTVQIIKKDQTKIDVSLNLRPWNFEGNSWGMGTIIDLSSMKNMLSRLFQDQSTWYQLLVGKFPIGAITTDNEGNVTSANPAALEILGSPSLEATLKLNVLTLTTLREAGISKEFEKVLKSEKPKSLSIEARYTSYWGKKTWLQGKIIPLTHKDTLLGCIATFDDITPLKEYEIQLRISEKQALNAHNQLRILMDLMNHDLRQPLQVILALVEVAGREGMIQNYAYDLKTSIRKIDDIVEKANELRDLIGIPTFYQPIDVKEVVKTIQKQNQPIFDKDNIGLRVNIHSEGHFQINGTYNLNNALQDIIGNLSNRDSKEGKIIEINLDKTTLNQRPAIKLTIHDNTTIMTDQEIVSILHPFQHLQKRDDLTTLFVAPIIAQNTGNLSISSNDQGTIFTIIFPELVLASEI